ncbi:hypothetical protein FEM33_17145 [Dyadobacter flavalbus]|uniref:Uncharacterized protein n=1 Tax=Dyadobacter flavalbus TaxID=2579942 RepID=A0A5M8QUA9_9BACT|nr:hypothetical protein [Dyadobacter flavalbus]KAA6438414.1 hypothetical protein FEM33_17145 [Dyadobacter flavalbus]
MHIATNWEPLCGWDGFVLPNYIKQNAGASLKTSTNNFNFMALLNAGKPAPKLRRSYLFVEKTRQRILLAPEEPP